MQHKTKQLTDFALLAVCAFGMAALILANFIFENSEVSQWFK